MVTNLQKIAEFPLIFFSDIEILFINCSMFFKPERDLGSFKNPIYYDLRIRRSVPFRFYPFSFTFFFFISITSGDHWRLDWIFIGLVARLDWSQFFFFENDKSVGTNFLKPSLLSATVSMTKLLWWHRWACWLVPSPLPHNNGCSVTKGPSRLWVVIILLLITTS